MSWRPLVAVGLYVACLLAVFTPRAADDATPAEGSGPAVVHDATRAHP